MRIFAIGDLHLAGGQEKPMDIFGEKWKDHDRAIEQNWRALVGDGDLVLVPGDISWAMKLQDAAENLAYLGRLPGQIVISKGNHDYWWQSVRKVRESLPANVRAIQNDHVEIAPGIAVCGSRGWIHPYTAEFSGEDAKIYRREVGRLELSLGSARRAGLRPQIVMLHFPPGPADGRSTGFTDLLEAYDVKLCVYGHLHGDAQRGAINREVRGVTYRLTACDAIGFRPLGVASLGPGGLVIEPPGD